jgi:hypothetical protein
MRRTTVRIDDELLADAKAFAAERHRSLNSVIEDGLRQLLSTARLAKSRPQAELPVFGGEPGLQPGVELTPQYIKELLDAEDVEHDLEIQRDEAARRQRPD